VVATSSPIRIGTSGWSYPHWKTAFYPEGLPTGSQLAFIAARVDTVEVNRTFYSLVRPAVFHRWREQVPEDFLFAVKGSRFITHQKKLSEVGPALANFLASGPMVLGDKLGPFLWQLPTRSATPLERVERFLELLPRDFDEAAALAQQASLPAGRRAIEILPGSPIRHALEVRHPMDMTEDMFELAREHGVSLVASQSSRWQMVDQESASFRYVRLHGPAKLYASSYSRDEMAAWASRVLDWAIATDSSPGASVFVYFDNDEGGRAPRQAIELRRLVDTTSLRATPPT
jgi:uncharacterized protein YecE (DUF72 family)